MYIGVGMTCTLGGLIQYHVQFMCGIIACLIYDQANIGRGGGGYSPGPSSPHGSYTYAEHKHAGTKYCSNASPLWDVTLYPCG